MSADTSRVDIVAAAYSALNGDNDSAPIAVVEPTPRLKGKLSRALAAKASLASRVDALGESDAVPSTIGVEGLQQAELRMRQPEIDSAASATELSD